MAETFLKACPRCGSENLVYGDFGRFFPARFTPNGSVLGKRVDAVACQKCGHLELLLRNPAGEKAD
jgi:ribosomal protein S27AE